MNLLLLDYMRRWWWVWAICGLVAALSPLSGKPVILAPVGAMLVAFDAQRGGIRPLRLLPLTLRELALTLWFQMVALVPLVSLLLMLPAGVFQSFRPDGHLIWFRIAVQGYVGLGIAAIVMLPAVYMNARPPEKWYEHVFQGLLGAIWGLSFSGIPFIIPHLPQDPHSIQPWHWAIFGAVPIAVVLSYTLSEEMIRQRAGKRPLRSVATERQRPSRHGAEGIPAFLLHLPLRVAAITVFIYLSQQLFFAVLFGDARQNPAQIATMQCALFGIMFAALMTEQAGLRALRVLPMSSSQLALLLSAPSFAAAITAALLAGWHGTTVRGHPYLPLELACAVAGGGLLGVAIALHFPRTGKFILIFLAALTMPFVTIFQVGPAWSVGLGLAAGVAGYLLLLNGIQRSSAFYQPRRMFGIAVDQPQG